MRHGFQRAVTRSSMALCLWLVLGSVLTVRAVTPVNRGRFSGVAIKGYDPVSYFEGAPKKGSRKYEVKWHDATWRFVSAEHRDRFAAAPEKFAPQYGGYCAYAVGRGSVAGIDPEVWTVWKGKLYLNYSRKIQAKWEKDKARLIQEADRNWPCLLER